jgi:excisionase family DNA binding protein
MSFLTVKQVCENLQLSERKVRELIARGDLAAYKFDGALRVKEKDLEAYVEDCLIRQQATARKNGKVKLKFLKV